MTAASRPEVSDAAVENATGRDWDGWRAWLDERGADEMDHREIVALVGGSGGVESGWWRQTVTVGYERLIGRRVTGQTKDTGFQLGVSRTVDTDPAGAWRWLTSAEGLGAWLGEGDAPRMREGAEYALSDGTNGEIRVVKPGERVRLTWHPPGWPRSSTIQLRVTPHDDPDRAVVSFHQEHIPGSREREAQRKRFQRTIEVFSGGDS